MQINICVNPLTAAASGDIIFPLKDSMPDTLTWDDTYAIARILSKMHPGVSMEKVSIRDIFEWTIALTDFQDDPELCNDAILMAIYLDWFEEENAV
mgnify:CR=1 FL=1